jgi:hypothetical protein
MSSCTSGCPTQDHASWGECLRNKGLRIAYAKSAAGQDATKQKRWDAEIGRYRSAVAQGMDPEGTTTRHVRMAETWSERNGIPYTPENVKAVKTNELLEKALN